MTGIVAENEQAMVKPLKDELLSAYLDDALSVADRDRVERHLAANPEDRQLVDELRVLRESLQSLPRHELPATFREKVLRQAERAMLTQPVETPVAAQANPPRRPKWLPVGGYRTLAWPAAVLAAAILLMVVYQEEPDKIGDVAQVAKPPAGAAEGEDGGRRTRLEIGPRTVDKSGGEMVETPELRENLAKEGLAKEGLAREGLARGGRATDGRATENLAIAGKQPAGGPPSESSPAAPRRPTAADDFASTPKIAAKAEEPVEPKSSAGSSSRRAGKAGLGDLQQTADRSAGRPFDSPKRGLQSSPAVDSLELEAADQPTNQPLAAQIGLGHGILLVQVDVSRRAAKARAFEKLLERQRIVPQRQKFDQPAPTALRRQVERSRDELESHAKKAEGRKTTAGEEPGPSDPLDRDTTGLAPEGVEMFYVEATERQVQAALEDLKKRDEEFPAGAVQPDPSQPQQTQFGRYQWGRQSEDWRYYLADWKDRERVQKAKQSAVEESRGSYGGIRRKQQAGQQVQEADGQQANGRRLVQQAPAAAAPKAPEKQLGRSRASPGHGGYGRPLAMGEARPLQIVFLLRVVDPEPASASEAVPDERK